MNQQNECVLHHKLEMDLIISIQFRSLHPWWHGGTLVHIWKGTMPAE